jgi:hypothetical protein
MTPLTILAGDTSYNDDFGSDTFATRGIYDYVLVSVDCVNLEAASDPASATNYFLGDWANDAVGEGYGYYDGVVCLPDLTALSTEYGVAIDTVATFANTELDVAPTLGMSRLGLPGPDEVINFEDLIILAMNYRSACTTPLLNIINSDPQKGEIAMTATATGLLLEGSGSDFDLLLDGELLGLTAQLQTSATLLSANSNYGTVLFYSNDQGYTLDVIGLADMLGDDTVINLHFADDADIDIDFAEGRDALNQPVQLSGATSISETTEPLSFTLEQNYPNPFNPMTTIRYSLQEDSQVELLVFNSLGQQVISLVSEQQSAGWHEATFDASSLSSGVYIYQINAADFTDLKKMILVK